MYPSPDIKGSDIVRPNGSLCPVCKELHTEKQDFNGAEAYFCKTCKCRWNFLDEYEESQNRETNEYKEAA